MKKEIGTGITLAILLGSFLLIGATAASVIIGSTQSGNSGFSQEEIDQLITDIVDDISTYLKLHDIIGKYYDTNNGPRLQRIAIPIRLLYSTEVDLSQFTIQLNNGNQMVILTYNGNTDNLERHSVFNHPLWDTLSDNHFTLLVTIDDDHSMIDYHTMNKNTDAAFLIFPLSSDFAMKKGDTMMITLVPAVGTPRTVQIEAPLPTTALVVLGPE